jgi:hypothetical protein
MTLSPPRGWVAETISKRFTTAKCMSMFYCRYLARKGDVVLEARDIAAVARAVEAEKAAGDWKQAAVAHASSSSPSSSPPETRVVELYKLNSVKTHSLQAPGLLEIAWFKPLDL